MRDREKTDLRVLKTRKKLENALLFYLKQESLNEIKVSLLCEKADVSRATFYNNFDSVQDVFKAYLIDLSAPLKADIKKATDSDSSREEIELMFWQFLHITVKTLYVEKDSFTEIFRREEEAKTGLYLFTKALKETLSDLLLPFKERIEKAVPYEIYVAGLSGLIPSALFALFSSPAHYTLSQMERYLYHMVVEVYVDYAESHLLSR
ncbi:MAG: TetR/AcrR family transcriptional regulator [Eubacteriales bacterium]|jgi:AcrR family transcriptional regulator|nr:TetR/AcrR family transcriptional regulator [Eubacteriales bacterium]